MQENNVADDYKEIASSYDVALTFPNLPARLVDRAHLLETFDNIFAADIDCVFLEGGPEIGKTILCAQYAQRHHKSSFSLFLGPYKDISADPLQLQYDLANQIQWYLRGETLSDSTDVTLELLRSQLMLLQRRITQRRITAYLILDGVEATPNRENSVLEYLLGSILPLGVRGFKYLISGDISLIPSNVNRRLRIRQHTVSPFSPSETTDFFAGMGLAGDDIAELHHTTRGVPGRLSTIKRRIDAGEEVAQILSAESVGPGDYYLPEWRHVDENNRVQLGALAALAFLPECRSIGTLATVVDVEVQEVKAALAGLTFLTWSDGGGVVGFVSDSFQGYARKRLAGLESTVLDRAIVRLHSDGDPREALRLLPQYLRRNKGIDRLTGLLAGVRVAAAIRQTKAGAPMLRALDDIRAVNSDSPIEEFAISSAILRTVVSEGMSPAHLESRIKALVAEGDDVGALQLANGVEVDETRLALLAVFLDFQRHVGRDSAVEIVQEVERLIDQVDLTSTGDLAFDIAANLVQVRPELAARAVEAYARAEGDANSLDRAFVRFSLKSITEAKNSKDMSRVFAGIDKIAPSESLKKLAKETRVIVEGGSREEVLSQVSSMPTTSEKLFFLRSWLRVNGRKEFACSVALSAARLVLGDTKYAPNAKVFRDLSTPLVRAEQSTDALELMSFLQGQSANAKLAGPSVDYYRLRFRMAVARVRWKGPVGIPDVFDDALQIDELPDVEARSACFAWLVRCTDEIRKVAPCADEIELRSYAVAMLAKSIDQLLEGAADHEEATRGALSAMAPYAIDDAIQLASRLNTEIRRDRAFAYVAERFLEDTETTKFSEILSSTQRVLDRISDRKCVQDVILDLSEWIGRHGESIAPEDVSNFLQMSDRVYDPDVKLNVTAQVLRSASDEVKAALGDHLWNTAISCWDAIEDHSLRLEAGCSAVARIGAGGDRAVEFAKKLGAFGRTQSLNLEKQVVWRYLTIICGRALAALAATGRIGDSDLECLIKVSGNILSVVERARLLGRSLLYVGVLDLDVVRQFVGKYLLPMVNDAISTSKDLTSQQEKMLEELSPALWIFNQSSARAYWRKLSQGSKERAVDFTIDYTLSARVPREPWTSPERMHGTITQATVDEVIGLLGEVENDHVYSAQVETLLKRVGDRSVGARINKTQKANLAQVIREMTKAKLPDRRGIPHQGYVILIDAYLLVFNSISRSEAWESIIARAKGIPNISDSCLVLTFLHALMPGKLSSQRAALLGNVVEIWGKLPSMDEKLARLWLILEECGAELGHRIKPLIEKCLSGYDIDSESGSAHGGRIRALVEMAYKIDEDWAASLVSIADQDPAREIARLEAREGIEGLRRSKAISESKEGARIQGTSRDIASACYRELGVVSGSGFTALGWQDIVHRLSVFPLGDLKESYPVIAFSMVAFATRYQGVSSMRDRAEMLLRAVNEAIVVAGAVGGSPAESGSKAGLSEMLSGESSFQRLARSGERQEIVSALATWLMRCSPSVLEVIDPYLGTEDVVAILGLVSDACPTAAVRFLTSMRALPKPWSEEAFEREVTQKWIEVRKNQQMPAAVLVATGTPSGDMPVHDRWWLCGEQGIWFGTSFGSLGVDKLSGMKALDNNGVVEVRVEVDPYLSMIARQFKGDKLKYFNVVF